MIYPRIPELRYKTEEICRDRILFFNPIKAKGIDIILHLAQKFPNEVFEVKETWGNNMMRSTDKGNFPRNVIFDKFEYKYSNIYDHCKLLILSSQIAEGYGRGIIEANINSIPIIASNIGGIPEAAGNNQCLVNDYSNTEAWSYTLQEMLKPDVYSRKCLEALKNFKVVSERYKEYSFLSYIKQLPY